VARYNVPMRDTLDPECLARIVFVLDRPKDAANIGAVVRLLGNFGLSKLRVVEPANFTEATLTRFAHRGGSVARAIQRFKSVDDALADCVFVLGATRRSRTLERPVVTARRAAPVILDVVRSTITAGPAGASPPALAAVLFGPEDFGLSNASLERCNAILTIPTAPDDASLNLSQAAMVVAYEIFLAACGVQESDDHVWIRTDLSSSDRLADLATGAELNGLFEAATRMYGALHQDSIEGQTRAAIARLRALILRAAPRKDEVAQLTSIFEHVARSPRRRYEPDKEPLT
jgi:TrmH family RNA methyltransferase